MVLINGLIKTSLGNEYPDRFQRNGKILTNKLDIANGFNEFFVNVGPSLASKIKSPSSLSHIFDYTKIRNDKSMFINDVTQNELCKVVNDFHSNASAPLFKIGDDGEFINYRPVSLLSQFSKNLENFLITG